MRTQVPGALVIGALLLAEVGGCRAGGATDHASGGGGSGGDPGGSGGVRAPGDAGRGSGGAGGRGGGDGRGADGAAAMALDAAAVDAPSSSPDAATPADRPPGDVPAAGGPVERDGRWVLAVDDLAMEVDPRVGGRITAFRLGDRNVLTGPEINRDNYGSTFWPSPQAVWDWPPPAEIDSKPYAAAVVDGALVLTGGASPSLKLAVVKRFVADRATKAIVVEYTMKNQGPSAARFAPWEVSRHTTGGLTFFPTGEGGIYPRSKLPVTGQDGITWWAYDPARITADTQLYADGAEGWVAHVHGGLLLLKTWVDVPRAQQAPMEGEIELYADRGRTYIEIEQQGAQVDIPAGGSVSWKVRWFLRALPADVKPTSGNPALTSWVRAILR